VRASGSRWRATSAERRLKRSIDVAISASALTLLAPALATITLAELVVHGWPPFFTQERAGQGGRIFTLVKFRTMTDARSSSGALLPDAERLTRLGRWLRTTSLDELPELYNVLKGDMSLVGPRPLVARYLSRYSKEQRRRHDVPVGLTGLAQVSGRNALSWQAKLSLDVEYVDNWSLALDLKILLRTVLSVLARDGISGEGEATMAEFEGEGEGSVSEPPVASAGGGTEASASGGTEASA
jgi:lipopolysaccharide/colanic/teichoic acid biosynthesis glycosyltransferase